MEASSAYEHVPYGASAPAQTSKVVQTAGQSDWLFAMLIFGPVVAMYAAIGYAVYALIALLA